MNFPAPRIPRLALITLALAALTFPLSAGVDFTSTVNSVSPTSVTTGSSVSINYKVQNIGTSAAGSGTGMKLYVSSDTTLDGGDTYLSPSVSIAALCAGCAVSGAVSRTIPVGIGSGTRYIISQADGFAAISEDNETNNLGTYAIAVIDCSVPQAFALSSPSAGASLPSSTTTVTLSWASSSGALSYDVYFGTSPSPPLFTNTAATSASVTVAQGTTYYWRVTANNSCGSTPASGGTRTFSVQASCAVPGSFVATSPSNGANVGAVASQTLGWSSSSGATSYDVYFGSSSNPPLFASTAQTSYLATGLANGTWYWRVVAKNACGSTVVSSGTWSFVVSSPSTGVDYTSSVNSISPPSAAVGASVTINYTVRNVGTTAAGASTGMKLYISTDMQVDAEDTYLSPSVSVPALCGACAVSGSVSKTIPAGVGSGTRYIISQADGFAAISEDNETNNLGSKPITITGCASPGSFAALAPTEGQAFASATQSVTLSWSASSDAASYTIYFGTTAVPPRLSDSTATTTTVPVADGITYYWRVESVNSCGTTLWSSGVRSFSVGQCPAPASFNQLFPSTGSNLGNVSSAILSWQASSQATAYDVYLGTSTVPGFLTTTTATSYSLVGLSADTYYWRVVARNACGSTQSSSGVWSFGVGSPDSGADLVSALTSINPTTVVAGANATIAYEVRNQGTASAPAAAGLKLYLSADRTLGPSDLYLAPSISLPTICAQCVSSGAVTRVIPSATPAGPWFLIAEADSFNAISEVNEANNLSSIAITVQGATPLPTPQLSSTASSDSAVALAWSVPPGSAMTGFTIERRVAGSAWSVIATVTAASRTYSDGGLTRCTSYEHRIRSFDSGSVSPYSNIAQARTAGCASCTAPPGAFGLISPAHGASILVDRSFDARWTVSQGATSYYIFFGPSGAVSFLTSTTDTELRLTGPALGAYVLRVEAVNECGATAATPAQVEFTISGRPAVVLVTRQPVPILLVAGSGLGGSGTFAVSNQGGVSTRVTLDGASRFTVTPASFDLGAGAVTLVTYALAAQQAPIALEETIVLRGDGVPASTRVVLRAQAAAPPGLEVPNVRPVQERIDLSAEQGASVSGVARFVNIGTAAATGVLYADVPWLIPDSSNQVTIAPGSTADLPFHVDRSLRDDGDNPTGSASGVLSFVYPVGSVAGRDAEAAGPPTLAAQVPVSDTVKPGTLASGIPPLAPGEVALSIPGVGHVLGSGNRLFLSNLTIVNTSLSSSLADLVLFYRSASGATTLTTSIPNVAPSQSLALADVVKSAFATDQQVGTLHLRSKDINSIAVSAHIFNASDPRGTFGTAIPILRSNRGIRSGETMLISGLRSDTEAHTNLYVQELGGSAAVFDLDFLSADGVSLHRSVDNAIEPFGLLQLPNIVPAGAVACRVENRSQGSVLAYATPVDDLSGDTWALSDWGKVGGYLDTEPVVVPVIGYARGANATLFRSDLSVTNTGPTTARATLTYYPRGATPVAREIELQAGATSVVPNAAQTLFQVAGDTVGFVIVRPFPGSRFGVTSRTYTAGESSGPTFGTGVQTVPFSYALRAGESRVFAGLEDSLLETVRSGKGGTFRTNLALIETAGEAVTVKVSLVFSTGRDLSFGGQIGSRTLTLSPYEFIQLNGLVASILGDGRETAFGDLRSVQVRVDVTTGGGAVLPYVTSTDNGTGDTIMRLE